MEEIAKAIETYLARKPEDDWIAFDFALFEAIRQYPGGYLKRAK